MTCFMCKGDMKEKLSNYIIDIDNSIIIVKNVPSFVCTQCDEVYFEREVAEQLEIIVDKLKNNITEVAIVHYDDKVA